MMYLQFDYQMQIQYSIPVKQCFYTLKCIPKETCRQSLREMKIQMKPHSKWSYGRDGWDNWKIYGCIQQPHDLFWVEVCGKVELSPAEYEEKDDERVIGMYRYPFGKCIPGIGLCQYFQSLNLTGCRDEIEKSIKIMDCLHQQFSYVPSTTEASTKAEEAWQLGMGVCQDFAHIFIVLLRLAGIPARYACGLLVGEGASHAWVEIFSRGKWIGLDPTNNCLISDRHIKFGNGRDASECAINRGIIKGGGTQIQKVDAVVTPIEI